jgi:DNA (cytosine-5)-methyltransferase 1
MNRPKIISLFSGAGGLDYGFEAAGFATAVALEMNSDCCETLRRNRDWPIIEGDIQATTTRDLLKAGRLKVGEAAVLVGGPPCQPFSKSGYWSRGDALRLDDPRASTLSSYLRVVREAQPKVFLLENVEGLAYRGKDEGLRHLLAAVEVINRETGTKYQPAFRVLNAADYGVPQIRRRFVLVASRDGREFQFPSPTHAEDAGTLAGMLPWTTAWDALGDGQVPPDEDVTATGRWAALLPSIPEGSNYLWHTDRGGGMPLFGWRRRYWSFLLKLAKDQPSWTIQATPGPASGPFHWANRRLSMRELCRLQTFPDDVVLAGSRFSIQKQIGNAVPSLLAEALAREIRWQLLGLRPHKHALTLLPPKRGAPPPAAQPRRVPKKFWSLRGSHTAHPGPGQGNAAVQRATEHAAGS